MQIEHIARIYRGTSATQSISFEKKSLFFSTCISILTIIFTRSNEKPCVIYFVCVRLYKCVDISKKTFEDLFKVNA